MEENSIFKEKESKAGPMIGSLIIIIVIVVGGLFYLSQKIEERKNQIKQDEQSQKLLIEDKNISDKNLEASSTDKNLSDIPVSN
jgi:Tfp pilus assembly protein PilO